MLGALHVLRNKTQGLGGISAPNTTFYSRQWGDHLFEGQACANTPRKEEGFWMGVSGLLSQSKTFPNLGKKGTVRV